MQHVGSSFPTRDQTWPPALNTRSPSHWNQESPWVAFRIPNYLLFRSQVITYHIVQTRLLWTISEVKSLSRVRLFATPWTVAHQAPPSMGFSRQEYWSGLPFPSPWTIRGASKPASGLEPGMAQTITLQGRSGSMVPPLIREFSLSVSPTLCDPHGLWPARLLCLWDCTVKNT